jgi:hypothetical protein
MINTIDKSWIAKFRIKIVGRLVVLLNENQNSKINNSCQNQLIINN